MSQTIWRNIPNLITLGRIFAVPVLVWLVLIHQLNLAFWLFILAGISDGLDGFLAKKMNAHTRIGAFLDPIADKFMLVSIFVILGLQGFLPIWLVIMVVFRDVGIVVGAFLLEVLIHKLEMAPNFSSKINTTVQIVLAAFVLGIQGLEVANMDVFVDILVYSTALTTMWSGAIYLYQWGNTISQANGDG